MTGRPASTYRVQLQPRFTFDDLAAVADYLAALGVGAVYASPMLEAAAGSTHGYDVVDPSRASGQLGGEPGRQRLARRLRDLGLGLVVDIVPNHVDVSDPAANRWWWDVLAHGRDSSFAHYFDIDWAAGPLLLPMLPDDGDPLAELKIDGDQLAWRELRFPIAAGTLDGGPQDVHDRQHYRLVSWRRAADSLTYRRFFDITNLAAVRVEDPEVFAAAHGEVLRWARAGDVNGLRVDHVDGLADPGGYLRRLRASLPGGWLVVEKILAVGEPLPVGWPVHGTTGYDALRDVGGVFVDQAGEPGLTALAARLCGEQDVVALEREGRRLVVTSSLRSEVNRIARLLPEVRADLAVAAVGELLASFPVYRSYLPAGRGHFDQALATARGARPELADALDVIAGIMAREPDGELATRVQQTSGMVMAKGVEDTVCYRYPRLVGLNEVGGDLRRFGVSVAEFHAAAQARESGWPATMTALSTHDTKRGEDVRARLAVLAELPDEFAELVRGLRNRHRLPEPTIELLGWQTLVGAWPIDAGRLTDYLLKAAREAKLRTTWTEPDAEFEDALRQWVADVLGDPDTAEPLAAFVARIKRAGWSNALGQKLAQLAGPGVPDVYQGSELWEDSLVDPDNRRPVDFAVRRALLDRVCGGWLPAVDETGAAKLLVVRRALRLRRERPELFHGYRPLSAEGPAAGHVLAFARDGLVAVATRLPIGLDRAGGWRDTVLPLPDGTQWTD
ncbi:MAG TPA: malto-oligosyltrehalose synthase, partial [Pseudonocardiaceae bacterium]|nr:malto-oligosyltrehalose synthase [Pseudonocardiaceae bacterium]